MKKALFIDRDGTLVVEPPVDYQLDSFEKLEFCPKVFRNLSFIRSKLDYEFVMVTNQDGLGTDSFPEDTFWPVHNLVLKTLEGEGITFDDILIDRSFPEDNAPTRKPRTGMMGKYMTGDYDLANSFVIGDRATDVELAKNLGCKAILLQDDKEVLKEKNLEAYCVLATTDWDRIAEFSVCRRTYCRGAPHDERDGYLCSASIWTAVVGAIFPPGLFLWTTCWSRLASTAALTLPFA